MTIFLSSHLLDQVQRICDRIGIMIQGRLVAAGPLAELAQRGLGIGEGQTFTLEEIYMKYFKEG
jgi:ABC-2 type transport system ATP-binding protein